MHTRAFGNGRADTCKALLVVALLGGVTGCETVEVVEPPAAEPEVEEIEAAPIEPAAAPRYGGMIVRIHARSDAEMPDGAIATVTLRGADRHAVELAKGERLARFEGLEVGRYDLGVMVDSGGEEIGSFSYFVHVTEEVGDVTVLIDYARAPLIVEADVETSLDRRYLGTASIGAGTCPDTQESGTVRSDLHLVTDGDSLELTIENFQRETLRLAGRIAPEATARFAAGSFDSSDGVSGGWQLTDLTAPTPASVIAELAFDDAARSCQRTLEYAGLMEGGTGSRARRSNESVATVEVVGHGQTQSLTLGRGESVARFDALLVGTYDVFVGVRRGDRMVDSRRESVRVTEEGARVETTFQMDWALPPASPLAAGPDYEPLRHTFEGKSVVASGLPACTGSIPLVDTTKLTVTPNGRSLALTFDSFYGKVLELDGVAADVQGPLTASGAYRSSDSKAGSWTIDHLATPTSRSIATLVAFHNETDACQATYEFAGVR